MSEWETLIPATDKEHGAPPSVRRLSVPGGWLYQVESHELLLGARSISRIWHPTVFVAFARGASDE